MSSNSKWEYNGNGDYSSWLPIFDNEIKKHCRNTYSFENGVIAFGQETSKSLFAKFKSERGVNSLSAALEDKMFSRYIASKAGLITLLVTASIVFLLSIVLAFSLMKCSRKKFRKLGDSCSNRFCNHNHNLSSRSRNILKVLGFIGIIAVIAVTISCFIYSAFLSYGVRSVACDFWTTMKGHFFGAISLRASQEVSTDWKGSVAQWRKMSELKDLVNPKPDVVEPNKPPICQICQKIIEDFNVSDTSLAVRLSKSRDEILSKAFEGAYLMEGLSYFIDDFVWLEFPEFPEKGFDIVSMYRMKLQYGNVLPALLKVYAIDLNQTTEEGIAMFRDSLDSYLSSNSLILTASYNTATNAAISLSDVDHVMAKMVLMWDFSVWPAMKIFLNVSVAISCCLAILGVLALVMSTSLLFKFNHQTKSNMVPSTRFKSILGVAFICFILASGLSFMTSAIFFFIGSSGSDGCGLVEKVAYQEGSWQVFPEALWNKTLSGTTNMRTVLDTCVKETGDGDVSASLGIRLALDKLDKGVSVTEENMSSEVNKKLDLTRKSLKTKSLSDMVNSFSTYIHGDRQFFKSSTASIFFNGAVNYIMPWVHVENITKLSFIDELFIGPGGTSPGYKDDVFSLSGYAMESMANPTSNSKQKASRWKKEIPYRINNWFVDLFPTAVASNVALDILNTIIADANAKGAELDFDSVCSPYLADFGICQLKGERVYVLDGYPNLANIGRSIFFIEPQQNPFKDASYLKFIKFLESTKLESNYYNTSCLITASVLQNDWAMRAPIEVFSKVDSQFTSSLFLKEEEETLLKDVAQKIGRVEKVTIVELLRGILSNDLICNGIPVTQEESSISQCTFKEVLEALTKYNRRLSKALLDAFDRANDGIFDFVHNVSIGRFTNQLQDAKGTLRDFNCQFIGTSIKEGALSGLCNVVMPSVVVLGVSQVFLWVLYCLGAFVTWKLHSYSNLEVPMFPLPDPSAAGKTETSETKRQDTS